MLSSACNVQRHVSIEGGMLRMTELCNESASAAYLLFLFFIYPGLPVVTQ